MTLYHFLMKVMPHVRSAGISELIKNGCVQVNGKFRGANDSLRNGDFVSVEMEALEITSKQRKIERLEVLYRDEAVVCVNKPAGLSVIPDRRQEGKTAVQVCREMFGSENLHPRPVHRLDKWTSGVLVLALKKEYVAPLGDLFAERKVEKTYLAFVRGRPDPVSGTIDAPIGPDAKRMTRMVVNARKAKPAITHYSILEHFEGASLLEVHPETGRTHQIRVHLSHIDHPVLCDSLYGGGDAVYLSDFKLDYKLGKNRKERPLLSRHALHAHRITFPSPATGQEITVKADLPKDLEVLRKKLGQYAPPLD
jgi:RluA family pseudouridine synthase